MSDTSVQTNIVEMVQFKLLAGTTEQDFLKANEGIQQFVKQQPGFLYRSLCRKAGDEEWTDIIYWQDQETAAAADKAFMVSPLTKAALSCIDPASVNMQHLPVAVSIASCD
ncbi:hypothetical protein BTA51_06770 [Hahella sp. CCB-MM4]|uniref:antibiotic biosynthesis monooxygenase family protein n=1 Tax=Hahella sp. (strain CCB-MM4) TaxID=1926491 RepID=UPI000B9B4099|nr:hypothetical protein [Hahella sp. CCB-MM4]OZG74680.1 hypothetical protein BTA51_06770 [Hahella sp. CCB-MM4]